MYSCLSPADSSTICDSDWIWVGLQIASCCGQNVFEVPSCNYRTRSQSVNLRCTLNNVYLYVIYLSDELVYICVTFHACRTHLLKFISDNPTQFECVCLQIQHNLTILLQLNEQDLNCTMYQHGCD